MATRKTKISAWTEKRIENTEPMDLVNQFPWTKENEEKLHAMFLDDEKISDAEFFEQAYELAKEQLKNK